MTILTSTIKTPAGPLTVAADGDDVVGCWFGDPTALIQRLALVEPPQHKRDLGEITAAVSSYLSGDLDAIDGLPTRQPGSAFKQDVWAAMRTVPAGTTVSYTELVTKAGYAPLAARAAGSTCATNLIAVIVPCHRIVAASGGLGGFAYGLPTKRWLLDHESGVALPL